MQGRQWVRQVDSAQDQEPKVQGQVEGAENQESQLQGTIFD